MRLFWAILPTRQMASETVIKPIILLSFLTKTDILFVLFADDLGEGYKRLRRLVMEYLGMTPPPTTDSELLSSCGTSLESLETFPNEVNASNTTSVTINVAARTWSRRSGSSTRLSNQKGNQSTAERTPVVGWAMSFNITYHNSVIFTIIEHHLSSLTRVSSHFLQILFFVLYYYKSIENVLNFPKHILEVLKAGQDWKNICN